MLIISMQARLGQVQQHKQACREQLHHPHAEKGICTPPAWCAIDHRTMDMTNTQKAGATGRGVRAPGMSSGGQSCVEQRDHSQGPPCLTSESCWQSPSPRQQWGHHPAAIMSAIISQHNVSRLMRPKCNKEEYQHFQPINQGMYVPNSSVAQVAVRCNCAACITPDYADFHTFCIESYFCKSNHGHRRSIVC